MTSPTLPLNAHRMVAPSEPPDLSDLSKVPSERETYVKTGNRGERERERERQSERGREGKEGGERDTDRYRQTE